MVSQILSCRRRLCSARRSDGRACKWPSVRRPRPVTAAVPPGGLPPTPDAADPDPQQQQWDPSLEPSTSSGGDSPAGEDSGPIWTVPWSFWDFVGTTGWLWVANQAIPAALVLLASQAQGIRPEDIPGIEQEVLGLVAQIGQLAATAAILGAATAPHRPLPAPWFQIRFDSWGIMLGGAAAVAAAGGGVLIISALSSLQADGVAEWRQVLATSDTGSTAALVAFGAVLLAPVCEEVYFRGYVLASLTKWTSPAAAIAVSSVLFAAAHPAGAFLPELMLGAILGTAYVASRGNLAAPLLGHAAYNAFVVAAAVLLRASAQQQP